MATMQDVIRRIQIQARQEGVDQTTASLQKLAGAQDVVAIATSNTERATVSVQGKLTSLMKTLDAEYASEQKLAAVEKTLTAARNEGLVSIERENELLSAAKLKYTEAGEAVKVMEERIATAKEVALGFAGAIGAGFAFGGLAELPEKFKQVIEAAAGLKDTAETIGITAENLQRLQFAASQSGVSTDDLNSALEKFSKNLGEAETGTGELYKILKANHVTISGDVTKDFENYANLVQGATNAEQKNLLVSAAFGKNAQELGNLFNEGAEGVRNLADEADKAGVIMSDSTLSGAKELDDEMSKLTMQFNSTFSDFAILTAPLVIEAMKEISASIRDIKGVVDELSQGNALQIIADIEKGKLDGAANLASKAANAINPGALIASPLTNWINSSFNNGAANDSAASTRVHDRDVDPDIPRAVVHGATVIPTTPGSSGGGSDSFEKLIASAKNATASLKAQEQALTETAGQAAYLTEKQNLLNKANSDGLKLSPTQLKQIDAEAKSYANAKLQLAGLQETMADQSPWDAMEQSIAKQSELLKAGAINWSTYATEIGKSAETMVDSYGNAANDVIGNLSNLTDAMGLQGKAAFEVQKDLSIARAVVAGGEAIVHSYNAGAAIGGPPVGFTFAAVAAAATAAQIAAIASTSYQSTSSVSSTGGSSSSTPAAAAAPVQAGPTVNVQFLGSANTRYSRDEVLTLIDAINSATNNGAKLNVAA